MKHQPISFFLFRLLLILLITNCCSSITTAQPKHKELLLLSNENKTAWPDENIFRENLKSRGLSDAVIYRLIEQRKLMMQQGRKVEMIAPFKSPRPLPSSACSSCSDMGGENGWGAWQALEGINKDNTGLVLLPPSSPVSPRFNLTSGAGIDAETPGPNAGDPIITVVAPGLGNASIQLGEIETNGTLGGCDTGAINAAGCAERMIYPLMVSPSDTIFTYAYAFVIENPGISHTYANMPFVEFMILDPIGDTLQSFFQHYAASDTIPGMYSGNHIVDGPTAPVYKPWTIVTLNLSPYIGQCLSIVITNADCQLGGHFAQSYWDFSCSSISLTANDLHLSGNEVIVYPNPITHSAIISISNRYKDQNAMLTVYDVLNRPLFAKNVVGYSSTLDQGDLTSGIYLVKITSINGDLIGFKKIIIE